MHSETNQDNDKIPFKDLKDACGAGINEVYDMIHEIIEKRPGALITLLKVVSLGLGRKHEPNKYQVAEGQSKTIQEVMAMKESGDIHVLIAAVRRAHKVDDKDEWMVLSRLKLELMSAMFEYVITHDDNGTARDYVAYIRDHGPDLERSFLDDMNRWSANSVLGTSRAYVESWIRTAAKKLDPSNWKDEEKDHQHEKNRILQSMKQLKKQVTRQDMLDQYDIDEDFLKKIDDTNFEMDVLGFTNAELFEKAVELEAWLTYIDKIHATVNDDTNSYAYEKLIFVRGLQELRESVLVRKQQLAAEMFQRLYYIKHDDISGLDHFECDYMIPSLVIQFNDSKRRLIKSGSLEPGKFWSIGKSAVENWMTDTEKCNDKMDMLTPGQILRYMIYISDSGTDDQKLAVKNMLPAEVRYAPVGLTQVVIRDARKKKIFCSEEEFSTFCKQAEKFHDADEQYSRVKVLHKIVGLSENKHDFDAMMAVCKIDNDGCRDIFDRLFLSDVICTNSNRANEILSLARHLDSDPLMQAVLAKMMEKFNPMDDKNILTALRAMVKPLDTFGCKCSVMFMHNCLSVSESFDDFIKIVKDAATALKGDNFQYILYNCMDSSHVSQLYQRCFDGLDSDNLDTNATLIERIGSQRQERYLPSMNIAAGYLHDVMSLQEGRDNLLKDIIMLVVAVNDCATIVFTPMTSKSSIEKVEELFNLLSSLSFTLRDRGLQDLPAKIVLDVMSSKSEEIKNANIKVKMRVTILRLLDFITRTEDISFDHASALSRAMFALYRKVKSGKSETSEIRQQLLSDLLTVSHILDLATKTPCDNNKIKKMLDDLTQRNTATIGDELKVFSRCLQDCLPTNKKSIHAKSEPLSGSLGNFTGTAFSRRSKSLMESETTNKSRNNNNNMK